MRTISKEVIHNMQLRALEDEVGALSAEMTRLRLMVQQCTDREQRQASLAAENERLKAALLEAQTNGAIHSSPRAGATAAPGTLDALPAMFSGADGTARLFKAIMDAYPWLVPTDVQEAQEIVRQERELQAEERRQRHSRRAQRQQVELDAEREESLQERIALQRNIASADHHQRGTIPPLAAASSGPSHPVIAVSSTAHHPRSASSDHMPPISPRPSGTPPLQNVQASVFDRPPTPAAASDGWGGVESGAQAAPSAGSQSQSSSPVQAPPTPGSFPNLTAAMSGGHERRRWRLEGSGNERHRRCDWVTTRCQEVHP
ncbi:Hypothetical protein, putative [Bodo saltans]|uniref:Uncharacterized protein n=1 Tax=Bodo saltans TaxID=75058 RepID=A0A0S4J631_BODSA|nr:Hypothetical protein, putative [Bodo saltans]|eukprot:CUG38043.1 Hypothetical protein, putative [Bodo saltans]